MAQARRLAPEVELVGVISGSQGGREVIEDQLRQAGASEDDLAKARMLTAITEQIVRSNMSDGFPDLEAFKATYANQPWLKIIQPRSYTGLFLMLSTADLKVAGPAAAQDLSFTYDPLSVIKTIKPRQLWLLGGSDHHVPSAGTQAILR